MIGAGLTAVTYAIVGHLPEILGIVQFQWR